MICPRCNNTLKRVTVKDLALDTCESCEGLWLDRDELQKIISISIDQLEVSAISDSLVTENEYLPKLKNPLNCPFCNALMQNFNYCYDSGVLIDKCRLCGGIWLDDGELKRIIDYLNACKAPISSKEKNKISSKLLEVQDQLKK